ncbi:SufE family protein [Vibrio sinaloensis]|uniref:SufE family protein n=1 Tax=Photobacterium sp. (strain ATCC 43367) TaxID=379097 RepID=UPI00057EA961|nr:SufE family protein [Vibrio sinaloensis]KHT47723.1 cysteine dioxygenase [Vibrio sinaloensis]
MTPEKVLKNFSRCADWEERYLYLIELGERLPAYPLDKQQDDYLVTGCQSQVWVDIQCSKQGILTLRATSDSSIVKGLLSLISIAYDKQSVEHAKRFDVHAWFDSLELKSHLTPGRTQGLDAIIQHVRHLAAQSDITPLPQ